MAESSWLAMVEEARKGDRLCDNDGASIVFQVWVRTGKLVSYHESVEKEPGYQVLLSCVHRDRRETTTCSLVQGNSAFAGECPTPPLLTPG